jgi:hypothetical protein
MKAVMPKLGQAIETPGGMGQVVSMQLLKELVTVRLDEENVEVTFRCDELGLGTARQPESVILQAPTSPPVTSEEVVADLVVPAPDNEPGTIAGRRRRRRRSGRHPGSAL